MRMGSSPLGAGGVKSPFRGLGLNSKSTLSPEAAITLLRRRLERYAQRPRADQDYVSQTEDALNALVDLYNEAERLRADRAKTRLLLAWLGHDPALADVPEEMLRDHCERTFVSPIEAHNHPDPDEAERVAWDLRETLLLSRWRTLSGFIRGELEERRLWREAGREMPDPSIPDYIRTPREALQYLLRHGIG